jgi:Protein of unknown function (DUF4058)
MQIHDWTRVNAGLFHAFHQRWINSITDSLNDGLLPDDHYALPEQRAGSVIPDVLTLRTSVKPGPRHEGGVAVADAPIKTSVVAKRDPEVYAERKNRITIRHVSGTVVAVIEILSPGNKSSRNEYGNFVQKADDFLRNGVHLLLIDLHPPTARDPNSFHADIWDPSYIQPTDRQLTLASYDASLQIAYVEPMAVGMTMPNMPVFLHAGLYIEVPLQPTYDVAWHAFPRQLKGLLESQESDLMENKNDCNA